MNLEDFALDPAVIWGQTNITPVTLDPDQEAAIRLMESGKNTFLTGRAGCGKSLVITEFVKKRVIEQRAVPQLTATTGVAALNLRDQYAARKGGLQPLNVSTIYRWSGIMLGPHAWETHQQCYDRLLEEMQNSRLARYRDAAFGRIGKAKTLVIDEISMLPGRVFSFLEFLCRTTRGKEEPWGGIQVIVVGDMLQLPPVAKTGRHDWCFMTEAWKKSGFQPAVLTVSHRQSSGDDQFLDLLNAVREGKIEPKHQSLLATRVAKFPESKTIRLFTHNVQVDKWNTMMLSAIEDQQEHEFVMTDTGDAGCEFLRKNLLTPERLKVKVGARVMITANLTGTTGTLYAVNGSLGDVVNIGVGEVEVWSHGRWREITTDVIDIVLTTGEQVRISRYTWLVDPAYEDRGGVTQFPLRLAWASTLHKVQGISLDEAIIDVRAAREPGQVYCAVSRVRTLNGLWLKDVFTGIWVSNEAIDFWKETLKQASKS